ncbi:TetR/AcrR family transcriptional regulator [Nocardia sp. alder85J]|uniref:TetR/AcrR family transcriptional regulator n=1 Tax=Nocardia sp. alder85J TaxID=2862949 RepID=UPI001CD3EBB3|nr:TetR/AcrR family transcriptional regulator [Nocardia sp. alder85J]MCX4091781.1 TetR/AcrR family transcriptional regulator [Nocardia sp. alder85J]
MPRPADPGRNALLTAGAETAERSGLRGLSVNAVVEAAGMAKGSFYHHFPSRREYVLALHRRYHDELTELVLAAVAGMPVGAARIRVATTAYLDACRHTRGTKAFLAQSRTDVDLIEAMQERNERVAVRLEPDLTVLGWPDPHATATMYVAMIAEIALLELYAAAERPELRAAALTMIENSPA